MFAVGTGVAGVAFTVIVVVAAGEVQPATVWVKLTVYVPAVVAVKLLLAVVPDTVPAAEVKVAPAGLTLQA